MFPISEGNGCWCVVHASGAVREFGGHLFLAGCSADWLLEKTETLPDRAGCTALMLHWPNMSARECFITLAPHPTRHDTDSGRRRGVTHIHTVRRGVTRIDEEEEEEEGGDLFFSVTWKEEMRERKLWRKRRKMVAFVNNRIWHFLPVAVFPDNCHAD